MRNSASRKVFCRIFLFCLPAFFPLLQRRHRKSGFLCVKVSVGPKNFLTFHIRMSAATLYEKDLAVTNYIKPL